MSNRRGSSLDRILGRIEDLDTTNLTILVQRLARERALLESIFNVVQEGIIVIDSAGTIDYANASAAKLIGLNPDTPSKSVIWKLVPDLAKSLRLNLGGEGNTARVVTREVEITYPERRFVRLYVVPFNPDQQEERFALILSDITEEYLSIEERIESEKVSSIFMLAAGVAHEIGNPLNSLNIHLQLARRRIDRMPEGADRDKLLETMDICSGEIHRLDGIIRNFLKAIRPGTPDLQTLDPIQVLTEVVEFQADELHDLGIEVSLEIKETCPEILGDRNQLKQVFFNVIKNAMEAMDSGGQLTISCRSDAESVFIYVADSGVGIDQEDLATLFHPYQSSKRNGHGLGMLIVQRIMREHGGQIGIDSKRGTGTVITLQFPRKNRRLRMIQA